jgi:hypothetical protein
MDANNCGFLMVLFRNTYFAVSYSGVVFMFQERVATAAATSSPDSYMTSSPATCTTSPGNSPRAVA